MPKTDSIAEPRRRRSSAALPLLLEGLLVLLACVVIAAFARLEPQAASSGPADARMRLVRLDARFDALVPRGAELERILDGHSWVEGPVWSRAGGFLLFSDIPSNRVFRWKRGEGVSLYLHPSGYTGPEPFAGKEPGSNGLAFDAEGRLLLAEHGDRRIARLEKDGSKTTLADRYQGKRLNSPNDLVLDSRGNIYFTDPPFGLPRAFDDPAKELPFQGVYRLSPSGQLRLLTREFLAPNGIALSPDERTLYITDVHPERAAWYAYELLPDGSIANARVFHDAARWKRPPFFGPDGLKVDRQGNVFAARPGGINVFAPDGTLLGSIETGMPISNCAWGEDGSVLYVTGGTAVYRIRLGTRGSGF